MAEHSGGHSLRLPEAIGGTHRDRTVIDPNSAGAAAAYALGSSGDDGGTRAEVRNNNLGGGTAVRGRGGDNGLRGQSGVRDWAGVQGPDAHPKPLSKASAATHPSGGGARRHDGAPMDASTSLPTAEMDGMGGSSVRAESERGTALDHGVGSKRLRSGDWRGNVAPCLVCRDVLRRPKLLVRYLLECYRRRLQHIYMTAIVTLFLMAEFLSSLPSRPLC